MCGQKSQLPASLRTLLKVSSYFEFSRHDGWNLFFQIPV